ncbi:LysE/ArgO family amino acid transporter [Eubacterium ramulus]|uniref:Arginine exporter protein ArgO n=1 Tax=Eubacterium ramulus TaxID=39490 RepID=A0A173V7Y8_EUBRA|nr:LysE family transporter [Eubacterium ramulus]CUN22008.1 Arginine exporter protein ArgO [Eubacterium ramulus]
MNIFLQGLTMGLAYVAPIGMQNLFVINSALTNKRKRALLTALIVIFFDITLSLACFFGIGTIMQRFKWLQMVILCVGSLIVIYIGISLLRAKTQDLEKDQPTMSIKKTISSACVVTWFNPQAIIDGTMMLGAFHVTLAAGQETPFITGVACASFSWFIGLTFLISLISSKFNAKVMRWINIVCGVIIIGYGLKLFVSFVQMLL